MALLRHRGEVMAIALTPDGRAAVTAEGRTLFVWSLPDGAQTSVRKGHTAAVRCVVVHGAQVCARAAGLSAARVLWPIDRLRALAFTRISLSAALALTRIAHAALTRISLCGAGKDSDRPRCVLVRGNRRHWHGLGSLILAPTRIARPGRASRGPLITHRLAPTRITR